MPIDSEGLAEHVSQQIKPFLNANKTTKILVGYSGGLDSTVLLHVITELADKLNSIAIEPIHINHGVNQSAQKWVEHCQSFCDKLNLPLIVSNFSLGEVKSNREATYRQVRYEAFADLLGESGLLLTAHHQQDQVETVFFNLFRGGGVSGLRGMQASRDFADGFHLRPLLSISPDKLVSYAHHHQLSWIDDPSNQALDLDRNYIRHKVLPEIEKRWPAVQASISRSAELLGQSEIILNEIADQDVNYAKSTEFPGVIKNQYLSVLSKKYLNSLSKQRKRNVLKYWVEQHSRIILNSSQIDQIIQDISLMAKKSGLFELGNNYEIRNYIEYLYIKPKLTEHPNQLSTPERVDGKTYLFKDLSLKLSFTREMPVGLEFKLRELGERVQYRGQTKSLKKLYQEFKIPPWERTMLPLLYLNNQFISIAGTDGHSDYLCTASRVYD